MKHFSLRKRSFKPLLQLKNLPESQKIVIPVNNGPWKLFLQELFPQFLLVDFLRLVPVVHDSVFAGKYILLTVSAYADI